MPKSSSSSEKYGPQNPHPLSTRKTGLVWEGKYDEYGNRREVDVAGCAMPLQKIETVDEPRARVEAQGGLFDTHKAHLDDFRNMLGVKHIAISMTPEKVWKILKEKGIAE